MQHDISNLYTGIPSAVLPPANRAFWTHEAEWVLLHCQGERHADILWDQYNGRPGFRDPGGDEEPSLWCPGCGRVQPHPGDTMEQERHHLQVSTVYCVESCNTKGKLQFLDLRVKRCLQWWSILLFIVEENDYLTDKLCALDLDWTCNKSRPIGGEHFEGFEAIKSLAETGNSNCQNSSWLTNFGVWAS